LLPKINQITVILGSLWLLWVFSTRYGSEWTEADWAYISFFGLVVIFSAYSLIKEKRIKKREE